MDREAALREHYDAFAADYVGVNQGVEDILSCFQVASGASVLDIGCGTGNLTFRLPEAGAAGRIVGIDISDGVWTLGFLFQGGVIPDCLEALDANDDFKVNITDPIYLLNFLFLGGRAPPLPYPSRGEDPSEITLGCDRQE